MHCPSFVGWQTITDAPRYLDALCHARHPSPDKPFAGNIKESFTAGEAMESRMIGAVMTDAVVVE